MDASASKALYPPGGNTPFLLNKILVDIGEGHNVGSIIPGPLAELFEGRRPSGGGGNGSGGSGSGSGSDSGNGGDGGTALKEKKVAPLEGTQGFRCATMRT